QVPVLVPEHPPLPPYLPHTEFRAAQKTQKSVHRRQLGVDGGRAQARGKQGTLPVQKHLLIRPRLETVLAKLYNLPAMADIIGDGRRAALPPEQFLPVRVQLLVSHLLYGHV